MKMSKKNSIFQRISDVPYGYTNSFHLFDATKNSKDVIQRLRLQVKIPAHSGCVNSICWNESGKFLLSGSDDQHLCLTDAYTHSIISYIRTGHRANIFSAKFLPSAADHKVISCSGDGIIIYSDLEVPETSMQNKFNCHYGTAYEIMTVPNDPNTFLSCGEDGMVRWFDLRTKMSCFKENCKEDVLIDCHCAVTSLAINPVTPYQLAVGCADSSVRVFDRRMLGTQATGNFAGKGVFAMLANFTTPQFTHSRRITSLGYSRDGQEMLVSYSSDFVYLFDLRNSLCNSSRHLKTSENGSKKGGRNICTPSRPMMKRLRVRGDWSDTGPHARPESETRGDHNPRTLHANLMQRMSDVLTSVYNRRSRNQRNPSNTSSSSHSEDSEMEETDENEPTGENDTPAQEEVCVCPTVTNPSQSEVPESAKENHIDERTIDLSASKNKTLDNPSSSHSNYPQSGVDLSFTTIEVKPSVSSEDSNPLETESEASGSIALNLSLQNLRHEMSGQKELRETNATQSVISDVMDMDASSASTPKHESETQNLDASDLSVSLPESQPVAEDKSTDNNCDKPETSFSASTSNSFTQKDDPIPLNLNSSRSDNETQPSLNTSSDSVTEPVPDVFVASVPVAASESETPRQRGDSSHDEGEMALMMEVDAWEMDSGEDTRSPPSSPSSFDRFVPRTVPESIVTVFKNEECPETDDDQFPMNLSQPEVIQKFTGHRNARTMIKESSFWGDNFVMSGSDCGHIFIWDRHTAELVMIMEADHHVVNCLQPHPFDPILASSGIDYDIKLWAPLQEEPFFDEEKAKEIIKRNKVMLEETKDTITVPASFMIRMLASLNHITSGSGWRRVARQLRDENRNRRSSNR